ncbi:hypothetical protein L7F22_067229 [Adiantum nelumboides]|nr:hypothetical protein [Adiantum nelumboides]
MGSVEQEEEYDFVSKELEAIRNGKVEKGPIDSGKLLEALGLGELNAASLKEQLEDRFLRPKTNVDESLLGSAQVQWERKADLASMLPMQPTPFPTKLVLDRIDLDGDIVGLREAPSRPVRSTVKLIPSASSSSAAGGKAVGMVTSVTRNPASSAASSAAHFVRGKVGQTMFAPGGLEDEVLAAYGGGDDEAEEARAQEEQDELARQVKQIEDEIGRGIGLSSVPPGFTRGYRKGGAPKEEELAQADEEGEQEDFRTIASSSNAAQGLHALPSSSYDALEGRHGRTNGLHTNGDAAAPTSSSQRRDMDADLDELLPAERPARAHRQNQAGRHNAKREWAHVVDVNQKFSNFNELVPDPAMRYPFELDPFQKESIYHIEQGDCVFVAAHTSAGKTVVAEYAIALAAKHMTRCIYTSPIKALSNQKFRDFKQTFGAQNVGILTGDVQINPEAPCLIMTTEILRSMLYRGADLIRDVEFVIFDEVHYVNDQEHAKRPVPLEHFLYAGKDLFKIVDAKGQFLNGGIKDAGESIKRKQEKEREAAGLPPPQRGGVRGGGAAGANSRGRGQRGGMQPARGAAPAGRGRGGGNVGSGRQAGGGDRSIWIHLVGMLKKKDLLPVVTFVFSKKRCEEYASSMPNTDLNNAKEKSEVHIVIEKSLTRLKELAQISRMRELLARGIGVHHGGLLPIVKEVVELLFQRGLVKVLFATETFAMGVNMPARSVVFSGIRKHDGHGFRDLLAGEYTQMSGRAGRRGLDATGVVIINAADELPEMLLGQPTKLQSQFRLTYNMILNLLRVEALKVEEMIKRSFSENASQRLLPDQQDKIKKIEGHLASLPAMPDEERAKHLSRYYDQCASAVASNLAMLNLALDHRQGAKNIATGRIVILRDTHFDFDVAVVVKAVASREFLVLAAVTKERKEGKLDSKSERVAPRWPPALRDRSQDLVYDLREVPLSSIALLTDYTIKVRADVNHYAPDFANGRIWTHSRGRLVQNSQHGFPRSDEGAYVALVAARFGVNRRGDVGGDFRPRVPHDARPQAPRGRNLVLENEALRRKSGATARLPAAHRGSQKLRFIDPVSESVLLKGRVACEINSADELVLTELVLDNVFGDYSPEEVVALLSVFVFQERQPEGQESEPFKEGTKLEQGYETILKTAERVEQVQSTQRVNFDNFETKLKTGLVNVVYEWARGVPFEKITEMTEVAEGTIVRVITRLDETCREVRDAARVIGDADLFEKMEVCQQLIRRDIVFAVSMHSRVPSWKMN